VDDQEQKLLLTNDIGRLLQVLQRMPRVSEVWKYSNSSGISDERNNQTMVIQVGQSI
jgi:hypothetical protein